MPIGRPNIYRRVGIQGTRHPTQVTRHNTALVTGGAGFIGSYLVERLLRLGYNVRVLDDFSSGRLENLSPHIGKTNFRLVRGSVNRMDDLKKVMRQADIVFHMAAIVSVSKSLADPAYVNRVNVGGTLAVLEEARRRDVKRVIFASSAAVYGDRSKPPIGESYLPAPVSPYGATKIAGEGYCSSFYRAYGLESVVMRYFNVYGPRQSPGMYSGVMMRFAENLLVGRPLTIYGDGTQSRDFVNVRDVVDATILAAENKRAKGDVFNVGTGVGTTILELAQAFLTIAHARDTRIVHTDPRPGDIRQSWADVTKAKKILGYRPKVKLGAGLRPFLSWHASKYINSSKGEPGHVR